MSLENERFKTKTGYCYITDKELKLTRTGLRGNLAKVILGKSMKRILLLYGLLALGLFFLAYRFWISKSFISSILLILLGVYTIVVVYKNRQNSSADIIPIKKIKKVKFFPAKKGITRAYFMVYFETRTNNIKKRIIMLPGFSDGGTEASKKALHLFEAQNLLME